MFFEQVCTGALSIDSAAPLSDLHIEPVHRDVQPAGEFLSAQDIGIVRPAITLFGDLDAGGKSDTLDRDRQYPVCTVWRTMPISGQDGGDFIIRLSVRARSTTRWLISVPRCCGTPGCSSRGGGVRAGCRRGCGLTWGYSGRGRSRHRGRRRTGGQGIADLPCRGLSRAGRCGFCRIERPLNPDWNSDKENTGLGVGRCRMGKGGHSSTFDVSRNARNTA